MCFTVFFLAFPTILQAQSLRGTTPAGLAPGSPAGSYSLSGIDDVNLFNGNLNVNVPLMTIGGRGGAGYQMVYAANRNRWLIEAQEYGFGSVRNIPNIGWWGSADPNYTPGIMQGRGAEASRE